ncbi:hypothetical protein [Noviherbaspirillum galbum]|uniref:Ankyrin repeat domain-containing protein n=1 Tax=Noviherbaspirillum galbum TaxID=2709383 RepID=A0A6B3SRI0_9BURK|nr:hypothetical protein [Noviherbaspirillum galbum]NEX63377.1 hypothetical protein [Noviherbaspirillum galbum]
MQTIFKTTTAALIGVSLSSAALAADVRTQVEVQTAKAELVIPNGTSQSVTGAVKDAFTTWGIKASANMRSVPSVMPARPDEPISVQRYLSGTPVVEYECKTASAEIIRQPAGAGNAFAATGERYQACIYPFKNGVKVYVLMTAVKKLEPLTGKLFDGITRAVRGEDGDFMTQQINKRIEAIRENLPTVLVERIEVPGMEVQEPDKAAVAAIIPPAPQLVGTALVAAPVAPAAAPQPAPAGSAAQKIEARKNLAAMGLTYHSQDQFVAAIRRKDDVAVQVFLEAGGIDPNAKDKDGKAPADIAMASGSPDIARMIRGENKAPAVAAPAPQASPAPVATAGAAPSAFMPAGFTQSVNAVVPANHAQSNPDAVDTSLIPPATLAMINAQIDAMPNMSIEQKEAMRQSTIQKLNQQYSKMRALSNGTVR